MADDEEVETLATLCLWQGTERGVTFFAFNKLMYHLIARCCESASQWKSDISVVNRNSRLETNNVLKFDLTRSKTKTIQDPVVYAHKNKLLWDVYFALGMHLAMESQPQRQLFPDFFKTLKK